MSVFPPVRSVVGVSLSAPRSGALVKTSSRLNAILSFALFGLDLCALLWYNHIMIGVDTIAKEIIASKILI